jgi:protein-tyrosine phosphatase
LIDIHTHILPGIDDGPLNYDESLSIIKLAENNNIKKIICTPHFIKGSYDNYIDKIKPVFDKLVYSVKNEGIDIELFLGTEIYFDIDMIEDIVNNNVMSLNYGKYVLIEFPMVSVPNCAYEVFYQLQLKGYFPIVCHPERNQKIINDYKIVKKLFQHEVFFQINSGSLLGYFGTDVKITAQLLLKDKLVHFIASDIHSENEEVLNFTKVLKIVSKYMETEKAVNLVTDNPQKILVSEELPHKEIIDYDNMKSNLGIFNKLKNLVFKT